MAPREKSQLKRVRDSPVETSDSKKPRRSERISHNGNGEHLKTPVTKNQQQLPSPVTALGDNNSSNEATKERTATPPPPGGPPSQIAQRSPEETYSQNQGFSSPPHDTQAFPSQLIDQQAALSDEVEDEVKEGVWGYLFPSRHPVWQVKEDNENRALEQEESYEKEKSKGIPAGGYLIGRHQECDIVVNEPIVSNRHTLIFTENKGSDAVAVLEDLSSNGTFVNEDLVGRNQRRELHDSDEIAVNDKTRFIFKYPRSRMSSRFLQQYTLLERLGKGTLPRSSCVSRSRAALDGLQQEIAVLMGVSHPNVLCLKDTFNERNAVYLVLELAPEGELFNHIVMKQKLTEDECRKLFIQLFQGIKYLHDRNIVHRDIKPENILVVDKEVHVKLADFGLAKIIGEESFTTTLCGTPSYVAPEILAEGKHRKYTKAVDVWSLGVVLFDYPSPYWDSVGDPALDLIDSMLVVEPEKRYTVDQCLAHPWITQQMPGVNDSTDGLVAGICGLDVKRRGMARERTLLSSINSVTVAHEVPLGPKQKKDTPLKVYSKNQHSSSPTNVTPMEARPADKRDAREFMEMGGKGDQELFGTDGESYYTKEEAAAAVNGKAAKGDAKEDAKVKGKGKAKASGK
ncbi:hypothetical protein PG991_004456 [Apiospora marii]|uniref:Uncharacterized protein n=1 Tax=Apiospora marii TaxID=335849 RepID=A0ABR1S6D8_9PEZI